MSDDWKAVLGYLEPTRTYSNPTATDILRRMLDERGVEWWQKKRHTCWKVSKGQEVEMWRAWEAPDGSLTLKVDYIYGLTPAQAIAATLGSCNCPNNCTNGERTETCADGGTVSETYIRPAEEGSICPMPRASVIFEGQKLTFDEEDSARFAEIVKRHLRKLAGLEVEQ